MSRTPSDWRAASLFSLSIAPGAFFELLLLKDLLCMLAERPPSPMSATSVNVPLPPSSDAGSRALAVTGGNACQHKHTLVSIIPFPFTVSSQSVLAHQHLHGTQVPENPTRHANTQARSLRPRALFHHKRGANKARTPVFSGLFLPEPSSLLTHKNLWPVRFSTALPTHHHADSC